MKNVKFPWEFPSSHKLKDKKKLQNMKYYET